MHISCWSSDVCSSDLAHSGLRRREGLPGHGGNRPCRLWLGQLGRSRHGVCRCHAQQSRRDRQDADGAHQCDGLALHPGGFPPHSSLPSHLCPQCPSGFSTTTFTVIVPLVPKSNVRSKESPSAIGRFRSDNQRCARQGARASGLRSEEHTSELQSLMRISYAVFCLKKKKKKETKKYDITSQHTICNSDVMNETEDREKRRK